MANLIEDYLTTFRSLLPVGKRQQTRILQEIEDHLLESWSHEQEHGMPPEEALRRVLARFGEPAEIAPVFVEQAVVCTRRQTRLLLVASLALCFLLICATIFRYPAIAGSFADNVGYSCFCLLLLCAYGWLGLRATSLKSTIALPALRQEVRVSLYSTLSFAITYLLLCLLESLLWSKGVVLYPRQNILAIDHMLNSFLVTVPFVAWLIFTLIGSSSAVSHSRRISTGSMVGLWSGLTMALGVVLISLALNYALMGLLLPTSWSYDPICRSSSDLAACELGDTLGGSTSALLALPLLGAGLGTLGGVFSRGRSVVLS
ncbi:MAG: hypothetical protein H0W02_15150 [Ktedonobacteraceae bacterium]|nr:hypothetical protein [Ktedonobacteraceae bacterium]